MKRRTYEVRVRNYDGSVQSIATYKTGTAVDRMVRVLSEIKDKNSGTISDILVLVVD